MCKFLHSTSSGAGARWQVSVTELKGGLPKEKYVYLRHCQQGADSPSMTSRSAFRLNVTNAEPLSRFSSRAWKHFLDSTPSACLNRFSLHLRYFRHRRLHATLHHGPVLESSCFWTSTSSCLRARMRLTVRSCLLLALYQSSRSRAMQHLSMADSPACRVEVSFKARSWASKESQLFRRLPRWALSPAAKSRWSSMALTKSCSTWRMSASLSTKGHLVWRSCFGMCMNQSVLCASSRVAGSSTRGRAKDSIIRVCTRAMHPSSTPDTTPHIATTPPLCWSSLIAVYTTFSPLQSAVCTELP
mmetsp:Transcript_92284/g.214407  ORF Transcript_92284/g.214407 Transcript_92284/m.214407 type:complete len:301 (+) Transcript_92284:1335-2237(+)